MPGLFKSLSNLFRWKKKELADALADPIRDGKLAIEDSETLIADFTAKIAKLVAGNKQLQREQKDAEDEYAKYTTISEQAAAAGNVEDARQALELKGSAQKRIETLKNEIARNDQLIAQLRDQLSKARSRVAAAKRSMVNLEARHEGAKIRTELAKASSEFNAGASPLAALDDLERQVNENETEAEAWEEMNQTTEQASGEALSEKYASTNPAVDAELAALLEKHKKS